MQDPCIGIHVFNEVPLDEEGICCSSEDDNNMDEAMDYGAHGVSDLPLSRKEADPDVWYAEDVDDPDDPYPSLDAQRLREIEDLLGMEWNPKGVYVPPPDVKRNQTSTLKAKYEDMFDDEIGAVFAFLPIVLWEKNVFESNKQAAKK
jgi:hypothetical protein